MRSLGIFSVILWFIAFSIPAAFAADDDDKKPPCDDKTKAATDERCGDKRESASSLYLGEVIDTFAGDETIAYLNPQAANVSKTRAVAGIDFDVRLWNNDTRGGLWVYGETVHGVRSRDVNCNDPNNVKLSVCSNNLSSQLQQDIIAGKFKDDPGDQFIAILRGATSLEAYVGLRYEFPHLLQADTETPIRLYTKAQAGFLTVEGGGGDVVDMHQIAVGATAVNGIMAGSYLDLGVGRNDLFHKRRGHRAKIDGYLSVDPHYIPFFDKAFTQPGARITPFVQFIGDFDLGHGSDSIQTYFGLNFNFLRRRASPPAK
jgi:hypothetical protein